MWTKLKNSEPLVGGALIATLYLALAFFIRPSRLIEILNGVYIGVVVTVVVVYWRTGVSAIMGQGRYGRVQRFALGCALQWAAFTLMRGLSAVIHSVDDLQWLRDTHLVAIPVLLAIIAGIMQVTAPGMGPEGQTTPSQAFVHGRDSTVLLLAVTLGIIVACVVIAFESVTP